MATVPLNKKINFEGKTFRGGDELPESYKPSSEEKPAAKSGMKKKPPKSEV